MQFGKYCKVFPGMGLLRLAELSGSMRAQIEAMITKQLEEMANGAGAMEVEARLAGGAHPEGSELSYRRLASSDAYADRDSFVLSAVAGREVAAPPGMSSTVQQAARQLVPYPFGRTVLPALHAGATTVTAGGGNATEQHGATAAPAGLRFLRRLQEAAAASEGSRADDDVGGGNPYARLYGPLMRHATAERRRLAAAADERRRLQGFPYSASDVKRSSAAIGQLITATGQGPRDGCIGGSVPLAVFFQRLIYVRSTVIVVVIPVTLEIFMDGVNRLDLGVSLCIDRREMTLSLIPAKNFAAGANVVVSVAIANARLSIIANILTTALLPTLSFGLDTGGGLRAGLQMRLLFRAFSIVTYASVQFFLFDFIDGDLCFYWVDWCVVVAAAGGVVVGG
jgi:hypothetical protein